MKYNIIIRTLADNFNILQIGPEQLDKIVNAYKDGERNVTLGGKKYSLNKLREIKIYTHEKEIDAEEFKRQLIKVGQLRVDFFGGNYLHEKHLMKLGNNITFQVIGDIGYGDSKLVKIDDEVEEVLYVDLKRINQLKDIKNEFDFSKLVRLCEELNSSYQHGNYYSSAKLVRSIINHIPPIFGFNTFSQFVAGYGNKSFKGLMEHLEKSLKNIADGYLHETIRKKESLPNKTQVDFRQPLDALLGEIIRFS